jgi:LDH2 family malate/lactate/ureidoglycolate dehydrogenase
MLRAAGVPEQDAELIADTLVFAELRGVTSHGLVRLGSYIRRVKLGLMNPAAAPLVIQRSASTALLDGCNGFGQVVTMRAMSLAIEMAGATGAAVVGVRNSNHFGAAAYYVMAAVNVGMIGLVLSNSAPAMAPWGGAVAMMGTNPLAVGIPAGDESPVVLDMATSAVARGKIRLAAKKGEKIPEGWALDAKGEPTTDPEEALAGTLLPASGPKGYGLAFVIDVLSGILTGSGFGRTVRPLDDMSGPVRAGHLVAAINVQDFTSVPGFRAEVDEFIREIRNCPRAPGVDRIYVPGEIESEAALRLSKEGIAVSSAVAADLKALGAELGVDLAF